MKKQKGFTLIELMIVVAMIGIVVILVSGAVSGSDNGSTLSFGINGMAETRCIDGYKFVVGAEGGARQVMDEFGKGVRCK